MSSYLLLRSNKQSGPYSLEQLCELGLKPYDLVWTEGRSAAWRYPSEIEELKEFAPVVEEQPYDRFYKKPLAEKHFHETVSVKQKEEFITTVAESGSKVIPLIPRLREEKKEIIQPLLIETPKEEITPVEKIEVTPVEKIEVKVEAPIPIKTKFKVFVSLPKDKIDSGSPVLRAVEPSIPISPKKELVEVKQSFQNISQELPKEELKEEYSRPFDEIKRMYVETYLQRKQGSSRKERIMNYSKYAAAAIFIIILGSLIYASIRMDNNLPPSLYADQKLLQKETPKTKPNKSNNNNNNTPIDNSSKEDNLTGLDDENANNNQPVKNIAKAKPKPEAIEPVDTQAEEDQKYITEETIAAADKKTGSRVLVKPADLSDLVFVNANEYKRKAFGGIQNLQLTVRNESKYIIDKVMVEVQYLKPSEQPLKSEIFYFNAIAPNGTMTIKIPDNPRGIKVAYKITHIVSNQYDQDLAGL